MSDFLTLSTYQRVDIKIFNISKSRPKKSNFPTLSTYHIVDQKILTFQLKYIKPQTQKV